MFATKPNVEAEELNRAITNVHEHLTDYPPESPEYAAMADQLVKLYAQKKEIPSNRLSNDTLAAIAANLLGIVVIVGHERANVITSKALGFVTKAAR